jgi:hypothetical protein
VTQWVLWRGSGPAGIGRPKDRASGVATWSCGSTPSTAMSPTNAARRRVVRVASSRCSSPQADTSHNTAPATSTGVVKRPAMKSPPTDTT